MRCSWGVPRGTVCRLFFRSDRLVRLWMARFNAGGMDALLTRPRSGCPRRAPLETEAFQVYRDELAKAVPKREGHRQILVMDNASWHKSAGLCWHHFEPQYLPPYSPDFNPIERLWLRLEADWFWDFIAHSSRQLSDRLCCALASFLDHPQKNRLPLLHPEITSGFRYIPTASVSSWSRKASMPEAKSK